MLEGLVEDHCQAAMKKVSETWPETSSNLPYVKHNIVQHLNAVIEQIARKMHVPEDVVIEIGEHGTTHILKNSEKKRGEEFTCPVATTILTYAQEMSAKWEADKTKEEIKKEDDEFVAHVDNDGKKHAEERKGHDPRDMDYFTSLLFLNIRENDDVSFDDDLKWALQQFCSDDKTIKAMSPKAERTFRVQILHFFKEFMEGTLTVDLLDSVVYTDTGELWDKKNILEGMKVGECQFLNHAFKSIRAKLKKKQ